MKKQSPASKKIEWITDRVYLELFGSNRAGLLLTAKISKHFPHHETDIDEAIRDCLNVKALQALNQMESALTSYLERRHTISFSELPVFIANTALQIRGAFPMFDIWEDNENIDAMQ